MMIQKGVCSNLGDDTDVKKEKQAKENCLIQVRILHTLLEDIVKEDLTNTCFSSGFQHAFSSIFGEDIEYFAPRLFFNMDKLENQLNKEEFNEEIAMVVFSGTKSEKHDDNSQSENDTNVEDGKINPSTSNVSFESSLENSDVPSKKMPNKSILLKLFVNLDNEIKKLGHFNIDLNIDKHETVFHADRVRIKRVFIHESMERKVDKTSKKNKILQNKIDQLLEANIANDVRNLVMRSCVKIKNKEEIERFSNESKDSDKFCNDVVAVKEKLSK
uniref:Uncharacterized protein n=1 Tax=Tanacetum cinerariifolium TaxID=118510 RepID=A0A6L2NH29_TANCI|nr:hypothetical protein [Tanacetum cinerariifolium]